MASMLWEGEKIVAPGDHRFQRLLSTASSPSPAGEEAEAIVETAADLVERHRTESSCGHLDCERHSVEPFAKVGDRTSVVEVCVWPSSEGAFDEQLSSGPVE